MDKNVNLLEKRLEDVAEFCEPQRFMPLFLTVMGICDEQLFAIFSFILMDMEAIMIFILALSVSVLALSIVYLCCRLVYLNSVKNGITPYPWILLMIVATPTLGSIVYIVYCYINGYELHIKSLSKLIYVLAIAILLLAICSMALAVVCCSVYM